MKTQFGRKLYLSKRASNAEVDFMAEAMQLTWDAFGDWWEVSLEPEEKQVAALKALKEADALRHAREAEFEVLWKAHLAQKAGRLEKAAPAQPSDKAVSLEALPSIQGSAASNPQGEHCIFILLECDSCLHKYCTLCAGMDILNWMPSCTICMYTLSTNGSFGILQDHRP